MLRFILWLFFFYFLWRLIRILIPFLQRMLKRTETRSANPPQEGSSKPPIEFRDIKDADFEEIPDDRSQKDDEKPS